MILYKMNFSAEIRRVKMKKEAIYANATKKKGNSESSGSLKMFICARISMSAILSRVPVLRQVFNTL